MSVTPIKMFDPTVLSTSPSTLYTVSGSPTTLLQRGRIRFTNTTTLSVNVTAYGIPSGGSAVAGTEFLSATAVGGNSNLDVDVPVLTQGGSIEAFASTGTAITANAMDGVLFA